ncbi:Uncharacterised protein [Streptococcus pneumoniae]|nr:Uncharacterised protein [Streptococcus pneumoniae]
MILQFYNLLITTFQLMNNLQQVLIHTINLFSNFTNFIFPTFIKTNIVIQILHFTSHF